MTNHIHATSSFNVRPLRKGRPTPDIKYDDDAPVHWFDILADKIQDQKGKKD